MIRAARPIDRRRRAGGECRANDPTNVRNSDSGPRREPSRDDFVGATAFSSTAIAHLAHQSSSCVSFIPELSRKGDGPGATRHGCRTAPSSGGRGRWRLAQAHRRSAGLTAARPNMALSWTSPVRVRVTLLVQWAFMTATSGARWQATLTCRLALKNSPIGGSVCL
jgi:hypothetical protein